MMKPSSKRLMHLPKVTAQMIPKLSLLTIVLCSPGSAFCVSNMTVISGNKTSFALLGIVLLCLHVCLLKKEPIGWNPEPSGPGSTQLSKSPRFLISPTQLQAFTKSSQTGDGQGYEHNENLWCWSFFQSCNNLQQSASLQHKFSWRMMQWRPGMLTFFFD